MDTEGVQVIHQTTIPNLDIIGLMVRDQKGPMRCPCVWCDSILAEAEERMMTGGVTWGPRRSWPVRTYANGHVEAWAIAAR